MPRIKGFDEIEAEIASHKGKIAIDEWANFSRIFIDIYQRNRSELIKLLEEPSKNDELSMELFQNARPPVVKNAYTNEVLRSLFNYLSSLSALVDTGIRLRTDGPNHCTYFLAKDKLLTWKSWGPKAKAYIENGDVDLLKSIQVHGKMIDEGYNILLQLSSHIHSPDVEAVNKLIRRRNEMLSGTIPIVDVDN